MLTLPVFLVGWVWSILYGVLIYRKSKEFDLIYVKSSEGYVSMNSLKDKWVEKALMDYEDSRILEEKIIKTYW